MPKRIDDPTFLRSIAAQFVAAEHIGAITRNPAGHINDTFVVDMRDDFPRIILQRINTQVFPHAVELMRNVARITEFLRRKIIATGGDPQRETLTVLPARDGESVFVDEDSGVWRAFLFITGAVTYQRVSAPDQLYQAGCGFGRFQNLLADFPAEELFPVIPHFHDTGLRYEAFERAVTEDKAGRAAAVAAEIAFVRARREQAPVLWALLEDGGLPLRVTHNDTKINNVMLDERTGEAICVIDLDTVMPGSLLFDFGDAMRSGTNTGEEDEPNLDLVHFSLDYYRAFAEGFLQAAGRSMTEKEIALLPFSARMMTYECGMRFLTDHLNGDTYFHVTREGHNLDRARTQFRLVEEMEARDAEMLAVQRQIFSALA